MTIIAFLGAAPWVPTPRAAAAEMLKLAKLKKGEKVYDLGCGDGRLVFEAGRMGARATGLELMPVMFGIAWLRNLLAGSPARIRFANFWRTNLADADIVVAYLLTDSMTRLQRKFERELRPGTRVVSYAFEIRGWKPVKIQPRQPEKNIARILLYEIGKHR